MADTGDSDWGVLELQGVDLGDERRNRRVVALVEDLSRQPTAPIPVSSRDWQAMRAASNCFDHDKREAEAILAPHHERLSGGGCMSGCWDSRIRPA